MSETNTHNIPFTKMQSVGNDYIYIDRFEYQGEHNWPELSRSISDRHFGVGSDGLILIEPSTTADFRMRMFNSNGLEGEMCGNGLRCLAKYVYEHGLTEKTTIQVETKAGVMSASSTIIDGKLDVISVDAGIPIFERASIPVSKLMGPEPAIDEKIEIDGTVYYGTPLKVGVPHCVFFVDDVYTVDLNTVGPKLEHHWYFPHQSNIDFVSVQSENALEMRIWERGSGITLGSGTGASASVIAGILHKYVKRGNTVEVKLPGGHLEVRWELDGHVWQTGPAAEICTGIYFVE